MTVSIIVAISQNNVIGKDNKLIWHLPADLNMFKRLTMGHHIIMGRKTYESIGKALPGRISVVITRRLDYRPEGCIIVPSIEKALDVVKNDTEAFVIGGGAVYTHFMPYVQKIYLTRIHQNFEGDTFFSEIPDEEWRLTDQKDFNADEKNPYPYSFLVYERR